MPILADNITLTSILASPQINPGIGGWDATLNTQLDNMRGKMGMMLLARLVQFNPGSGTTGDILFTVPAGFSAICFYMMVMRRSSNPSNSNRYTAGNQEGVNPVNWHSSGFSLENIDADGHAALVVPYPGELPYVQTTMANLNIIDGDSGTPNFRIRRSAGSSWTSGGNWFAFGHAWPNDT